MGNNVKDVLSNVQLVQLIQEGFQFVPHVQIKVLLVKQTAAINAFHNARNAATLKIIALNASME